MPLEYDNRLIPHAKALRKGMTKQERHLWYDYLSTCPIRFQRQKSIDRFIVDFYSHQARLAVELDGSQHYMPENMEYDRMRTAKLESYGILVLRFTNADIDSRFAAVCEVILEKVRERSNRPFILMVTLSAACGRFSRELSPAGD
jgi:very-short-patch-repair endonuclease